MVNPIKRATKSKGTQKRKGAVKNGPKSKSVTFAFDAFNLVIEMKMRNMMKIRP